MGGIVNSHSSSSLIIMPLKVAGASSQPTEILFNAPCSYDKIPKYSCDVSPGKLFWGPSQNLSHDVTSSLKPHKPYESLSSLLSPLNPKNEEWHIYTMCPNPSN